MAASAGDKDILSHLTTCGADINAKERLGGRTALHQAVELGDPHLVTALVLTCRANLHIEAYSRLTPYQLALASGSAEMATHLMTLGAPALPLPSFYLSDPSDEDEEDDCDDSYVPPSPQEQVEEQKPSWPELNATSSSMVQTTVGF